MEKYSVLNCSRLFTNVTNVNQAILVKAPTLSLISKYIGDTALEGYIELFLIDLNESTSVSNPLTSAQIDFTSFTIVNKYRNLTLADLSLIFNNAKSGIYGSFYENISPDKVLTWFREYFELRMEACANKSLQEHEQVKESTYDPRSSDMTIKEFIKNIGK